MTHYVCSYSIYQRVALCRCVQLTLIVHFYDPEIESAIRILCIVVTLYGGLPALPCDLGTCAHRRSIASVRPHRRTSSRCQDNRNEREPPIALEGSRGMPPIYIHATHCLPPTYLNVVIQETGHFVC